MNNANRLSKVACEDFIRKILKEIDTNERELLFYALQDHPNYIMYCFDLILKEEFGHENQKAS